MDVVILSGQSNMSGRGGVFTKRLEDGTSCKEWDGIVPPECEAASGTILRLTAGLDWEEAHEPLHYDIDKGKVCGVGPGLVFAARVANCYELLHSLEQPAIGLVPCAVGGTQLKQWEKGSKLYNEMIKRSKAALEKGGTLCALLWYQGESDTLTIEDAEGFQQRLETFFTNVRSDLGSDNLPVIQVGITAANHPFPNLLEIVRHAQVSVQLPGIYYVDAWGLPLLEDNIHLNLEGQVELGKMLADAYLKNIMNGGEL